MVHTSRFKLFFAALLCFAAFSEAASTDSPKKNNFRGLQADECPVTFDAALGQSCSAEAAANGLTCHYNYQLMPKTTALGMNEFGETQFKCQNPLRCESTERCTCMGGTWQCLAVIVPTCAEYQPANLESKLGACEP